jgi:protoheme IX farnesyltransferase
VTTEPMIQIKDSAVAPQAYRCRLQGRSQATVADYWALTKPEINFLIAIATFVGFYLGVAGRFHDFPVLLSIHTLLGTLLVAAGTGTLNQYVERSYDAQMRRTVRRPVASGRLKPSAALRFGIGLSAAGSIYLAVAVNALASLLAVLTLLGYLFVYTPLKRKSPLCILVGAFPGAMPPLIGWAAANGSLSREAWVLYSLLFFWQFPHFMAIAWMHREDYARAGYLVLPRGKSQGIVVTLQTLLPLVALVSLSLILPPARYALPYLAGALLLGSGFFYYAVQFVLRRSGPTAQRLLFASIVYLPSLLIMMALVRVNF